ncbi:hypothetical protein [Odoribacter laneus]|uniref:hypothetical protein n=1 Tax=Odoribacter laneus TaxID=626933 RepID=UPI003FED9CC6
MNTIKNGTSVSEYLESIRYNHAALRQFFTAMPKGGDIHNHLTGSAYAETYFELAAKKEMYVDLETGKLYKEKPTSGKSTIIQLSKDMDDLHNHRMELIDKWSIRNFQPYKYPLGPDEYFFGTFGLLSALTSDIDNLVYLMHKLQVRALKENVQYLEVMAGSPDVPADCFLGKDYETYKNTLEQYVTDGDYTDIQATLNDILDLFDKNSGTAADDYLKFILNIEIESKKISNHMNCDTTKLKCTYQGYASRGGEPLKVFAQLYVVHRTYIYDFTRLLGGCNIVAAEDGERSMLCYRLHMEMFKALAARFKNQVPTSLHAGELTIGLVRPEHLTYHIDRAIRIANPKRIGHGVDLPFEENSEDLLQTMKDKDIPVEINLTSNEFILGVKGKEHPITLYHRAGVPLIISTDDPGILRTSLTEQYTLLALRYGFSYQEIKEFVYNSIQYAFLIERDHIRQKEILDERFAAFENNFAPASSAPRETVQSENGN